LTPRECLGLALRRWRRGQGKSQRDVGERAGMSKAAWGNRERGVVEVSILECAGLGIDVNALVEKAREIGRNNRVKL
jgi:transcriptional regulator with XRE-family HTH domain